MYAVHKSTEINVLLVQYYGSKNLLSQIEGKTQQIHTHR